MKFVLTSNSIPIFVFPNKQTTPKQFLWCFEDLVKNFTIGRCDALTPPLPPHPPPTTIIKKKITSATKVHSQAGSHTTRSYMLIATGFSEWPVD